MVRARRAGRLRACPGDERALSRAPPSRAHEPSGGRVGAPQERPCGHRRHRPGRARAFSRRAAEIEAHMAERGLLGGRAGQGPSPRARTIAAFATRAPRDPSLAPESLRGWWQERAREAGLSPRLLEAALDKVPRGLAREGASRDLSGGTEVAVAVEGALGGLGRSVAASRRRAGLELEPRARRPGEGDRTCRRGVPVDPRAGRGMGGCQGRARSSRTPVPDRRPGHRARTSSRARTREAASRSARHVEDGRTRSGARCRDRPGPWLLGLGF